MNQITTRVPPPPVTIAVATPVATPVYATAPAAPAAPVQAVATPVQAVATPAYPSVDPLGDRFAKV